MTEDNEHLLQQFFSDTAHEQIADNGFTERVMRQLPARTGWFFRLWTPFCITFFVVLFIVFRGWEQLFVHFEGMLQAIASQTFTTNMLMITCIFFSLLFVGTGEFLLRNADNI